MPIPLVYSSDGLHLTERFEGCALTAYYDEAGVLTIGYGHTATVWPGRTITQEKAVQLLQSDIAWASQCVNRLVKIQLTQPQFDALVDFVFNLGAPAFARSEMLVQLNRGEMEQAAQEFVKYDTCGGTIVAGLLLRRRAEATLFQQSFIQYPRGESAD